MNLSFEFGELDLDVMLGAKDAAEIVHMHPGSLSRLADTGKIPFIIVNGRRKYKVRDLYRFRDDR